MYLAGPGRLSYLLAPTWIFYRGFSFVLFQLVSHRNQAELATFSVLLSVSEYAFNCFHMNWMINRGEIVLKILHFYSFHENKQPGREERSSKYPSLDNICRMVLHLPKLRSQNVVRQICRKRGCPGLYVLGKCLLLKHKIILNFCH